MTKEELKLITDYIQFAVDIEQQNATRINNLSAELKDIKDTLKRHNS